MSAVTQQAESLGLDCLDRVVVRLVARETPVPGFAFTTPDKRRSQLIRLDLVRESECMCLMSNAR